MEKIPCEEKDDKDISKLVSGIVKCSINRQISYKTVGPNEVCVIYFYLFIYLFIIFFIFSFFVFVSYFCIGEKKNGLVYLKQNWVNPATNKAIKSHKQYSKHIWMADSIRYDFMFT